jgi:ComF family protein
MSVWPRVLFEFIAGALAPHRCAACDKSVPMLTAFCPTCAATLTHASKQEPGTIAPFLYGGAIADAITRFKYRDRPDLARPLAAVLVRAVAPLMHCPPDLVVPIPLHLSRLAERGFNQAALLARPVGLVLGVEFAPLALVRRRDTARQVTLDRDARRGNVAGAFAVRTPSAVANKRVLLVDDVRTTGATLHAAGEALRASGARDIVSLVIALAQ